MIKIGNRLLGRNNIYSEFHKTVVSGIGVPVQAGIQPACHRYGLCIGRQASKIQYRYFFSLNPSKLRINCFSYNFKLELPCHN
jgi:hypothetical protein